MQHTLNNTTTGRALTQRQAHAIAAAKEWGKIFPAYERQWLKDDSMFMLSPHILERKLRDGIEIFGEKVGNGREIWTLATSTSSALADALLQVRDLVGRYCGTMLYINNYGYWSDLYSEFRNAGIDYPAEPILCFDFKYWTSPFGSYDDLNKAITKAQVWGMHMILVLQCFAVYQGVPRPTDILPGIACAHIERAKKAFQAQRHATLEELRIRLAEILNRRVKWLMLEVYEAFSHYCPDQAPEEDNEEEDYHMDDDEEVPASPDWSRSGTSSGSEEMKVVRFGSVE